MPPSTATCSHITWYIKKQHCKNLGLEQTKIKFSRTKFSKMSKREILFFVSVQIFFVFGPRRRIPGKKFGLASKRKKMFSFTFTENCSWQKVLSHNWPRSGGKMVSRVTSCLRGVGLIPALFCFA